jgi:hypothetical protein
MATGPKFGSGLVRLGTADSDLVDLISSGGDTFQWNESGILAPGQYTLEVFVSNSIGAELSTFEFSLTVPSPACLAMLGVFAGLRSARRR